MRTKNFKIILALIIEGGNVYDDYKKAESWVGRINALKDIIDEAMALTSLNIKELTAEIADGFDDAEMQDIKQFAKDKYDIDDNAVEERVEEIMEAGLSMVQIGSKLYSIYKAVKK